MITFFTGNLSCPVDTGQIFVIAGKTIDGASRLDINLASDITEGSSLPLHFSIRFHDDVIIRNSYTEAEGWGPEEREENLRAFTTPNPLSPGDNFKIYIFIADFQYHIAINDRPFCTFGFRLPIAEISVIKVEKDVQTITQIDHRQAFPSPFPVIQSDDPRNVFSNDVPRQFLPGHVILITGIPFGNPRGSFVIRFTEGDSKKQGLHFNPRFEPHNFVALNAMNEQLNFGREERLSSFPFNIDQQFKMAIAFADNEFRFAVNGECLGSFAYRSPNQLEILNGFKVTCGNGLQLEITSVDHMNLGMSDCDNFQLYSNQEIMMY